MSAELESMQTSDDLTQVAAWFLSTGHGMIQDRDPLCCEAAGLGKMGLVCQYGARKLYRVGKWLLKLDISEHRWLKRELNLQAHLQGVRGIHRTKPITLGEVLLLGAPWTDRVQPTRNHVSSIRNRLDELATYGVGLLDCPWPTISAIDDREVLFLDLGRFKRMAQEQALSMNRTRLMEIADRLLIREVAGGNG